MFNTFDSLEDMNMEDRSNFSMDSIEDIDIVSSYEDMMKELEDQQPMEILEGIADQDVSFYDTIDELDFEYDQQLTDEITTKGKRSYNKMKSEGNEFEKEFSGELAMYYDLLEEINKFSKKLDKKFDALDGSKAKGNSKYLNDLITSIVSVKGSKLSTIKEITSLKKTIAELQMKSDKANPVEDGSLESSANSYFRQIMSVGRNSFINALNGDETNTISSEDYSPNDDIEYQKSMPDFHDDIQQKIADRLEKEGNDRRTADGDKYIMYENMNIDQVVKYDVMNNSWELIAVDENMQQVIDFPLPTRQQLGKVKFSSDHRYMTDQSGRSYKVIEKGNYC